VVEVANDLDYKGVLVLGLAKVEFGERLEREVGSGKKRRSVKFAPYGSELRKALL